MVSRTILRIVFVLNCLFPAVALAADAGKAKEGLRLDRIRPRIIDDIFTKEGGDLTCLLVMHSMLCLKTYGWNGVLEDLTCIEIKEKHFHVF